MALEEIVKVDQIEVVEVGIVQIRTATKIFKDGVEISKTYHRRTICPGEDYANEEDKVKAICAAVHTAEIISQFEQIKSQNNLI
jgi:hypothetical protein